MKILVIEDDNVIQSLVQKILIRGGYSPVVATNGSEGLSRCESEGVSLKAVIIDWTLPDISGLEVYRTIREKYPQLPYVITSGQDLPEAELTKEGIDPECFLHKPYKPPVLLDLLKNILT